ncbi:MAG: hypothetical protein HY064_16020 [Bacteroidetes bacterium]|nr:hypothetical protein [Bacteroidota bacterium]
MSSVGIFISDARISVKPGKPRQMNYTAQASVDTRAHVITNMMADFSDKRDSQSLPEIILQTKENLEENDLHFIFRWKIFSVCH